MMSKRTVEQLVLSVVNNRMKLDWIYQLNNKVACCKSVSYLGKGFMMYIAWISHTAAFYVTCFWFWFFQTELNADRLYSHVTSLQVQIFSNTSNYHYVH